MRYTNIGTDKIPLLALGTWSWGTGVNGGDKVFGNALGIEELRPIYKAAMEKGLNLWDTAYVYAMGQSEEILSAFMKENGDGITLSTKFTPPRKGFVELELDEMLEISLARLNREMVEIYWIHKPGDVEKWTRAVIPHVKSGKIKYVGVSNHDLEQAKRAAEILAEEGIKLAAVQNHFSLLYRGGEACGLLDWCKENDVKFFSYMVLEQGALTGRFDAEHPLPEGTRRGSAFGVEELKAIEPLIAKMRELGEKYSADPAQIAIAWSVAKGTIPIIGVTKVKQVESGAAAVDVELTADEVAELERVADATGIKRLGTWEKDMTV